MLISHQANEACHQPRVSRVGIRCRIPIRSVPRVSSIPSRRAHPLSDAGIPFAGCQLRVAHVAARAREAGRRAARRVTLRCTRPRLSRTHYQADTGGSHHGQSLGKVIFLTGHVEENPMENA